MKRTYVYNRNILDLCTIRKWCVNGFAVCKFLVKSSFRSPHASFLIITLCSLGGLAILSGNLGKQNKIKSSKFLLFNFFSKFCKTPVNKFYVTVVIRFVYVRHYSSSNSGLNQVSC